MEDELEDKIFYQAYISHMNLVSKYIVGSQLGSGLFTYLWRMVRMYILKPEILALSTLIIVFILYINSVEQWSSSIVSKIHYTIGNSVPSKVHKLQYFVKPNLGGSDSLNTKYSWEFQDSHVAVYSIQGRRTKMEDRFVVNEKINATDVSLYAIFDGHGGEFAANFAKDKLAVKLNEKVVELKKFVGSGAYLLKKTPSSTSIKPVENIKYITNIEKNQRIKGNSIDESFKSKGGITDPLLLEKIDALTNKTITREVRPSRESLPPIVPKELNDYVDKNANIDYGKLLTDEVLAADRILIETAKKTMDVAGTTALIALLDGTKLFVANVGDSRGVMCDSKGKAIPLSFDHKPQQMREQRRIIEAGGFISFNGVWRVGGVLATSRALGDYPLKERKLVIADPDILEFDLSQYQPQFIILASDGLWDTFNNEEAVAYIKQHLEESYFGAKSLTLQSFSRGSLDNITVLVINLSNYKWPNK